MVNLEVGIESQWVPKPPHYLHRRYSPRVSDQLFCIALVSGATLISKFIGGTTRDRLEQPKTRTQELHAPPVPQI
jgi:hypothetical protein